MLILGMSVTFFDGVGFGFPACVITTARPWVDFWPFWDEICVSKLSTTTSTKAFYCQSQLSLVFLSPWPLQQKFWNDTVHCTMVLSHWSIFVSIVLCDDRQEFFYTKRTLHNEKKCINECWLSLYPFILLLHISVTSKPAYDLNTLFPNLSCPFLSLGWRKGTEIQ